MKKKKFKVWHSYGITNFDIKVNESLFCIKKRTEYSFANKNEFEGYTYKLNLPLRRIFITTTVE